MLAELLTGTWPLELSIAAFVACALILMAVALPFARVVDRLADRTGMGEAMAGALFLGATTSMPGLITTIVAAAEGQAELAVSNALGGIAAQTMFLALADLLYRRANLEHAAASLPNLLQTMILVSLITLVLLTVNSPKVILTMLVAKGAETVVFSIHPITLVLPLWYLYGLYLTRKAQESPMWWPKHTAETRLDVPDEEAKQESLSRLLLAFLVMAMVVAGTGFVVARAGLSLMAETGLSGTLVGGLMTGVVTSLPELVTVIAAVRIGALTLAVGDIIGGNTFDVLFIAAADIAFTGDSVYHAIGESTVFILALTVLLTSVLASGLICREKTGVGFEGLAILAIYIGGFAVIYYS